MFWLCSRCGMRVSSDEPVCPGCGVRFEESPPPPEAPNPTSDGLDSTAARTGGQEEPHDTTPRSPLGAWWWQGLRSAFFLRADWTALRTSPAIVVWLMAVPIALYILFERLHVAGPATFNWNASRVGWFGTALVVWVCWMLVPRSREGVTHEPASAAALFSMFAAQALTAMVVFGVVLLPFARNPYFSSTTSGRWIWWGAWIVLMVWIGLAQILLIWRSGAPRVAPRLVAVVLLTSATVSQVWIQPPRYWYPVATEHARAETLATFKLTQELLELQPRLLEEKLQAIRGGRAGIVDVYVITFAPYAEEDVFQRESNLVATVMQERFGAAGRTIQLVNNRKTSREWPWATPLNLQRSIQQMAKVMNRDEDVLFIHLTSHGARNGELSAEFWPMSIDPVTPQMLKRWLDEAGIRYRVISVSACYAGSWIEPLSSPGTLVMTAADATHTSMGCGSGSTLTYFGKAMFDEQLRQTWSFEKAHAAARAVIDQREREAGKDDGYSNPQIQVGEVVRERLAELERERASELSTTSDRH
jgi:Peptidase C13 family